VLINAASGYRTLTALRPVTFTDYSAADAQFIIVSNARLFNDGQGGDPVAEYAEYRSTQEGGGYRTVVADVAQLYDQFAYGVQRHPLSIRNFAHFAKKAVERSALRVPDRQKRGNTTAVRSCKRAWRIGPKQQFSGADVRSAPAPTTSSLASNVQRGSCGSCRAPSGGNRCRSAPVPEQSAQPRGALGPNPCRRPTSGASTSSTLAAAARVAEQTDIRNKLSSMESVLENSDYGASVFSFYKTSPDPIQYSQSEAISDRINAGASIVTFFGHSSSGGFDFSIDNPANYRNQNRYPLMISLGCLLWRHPPAGQKRRRDCLCFRKTKARWRSLRRWALGRSHRSMR
jgi:hypothetical protein